MSFNLKNESSMFQHYINDILHDFLNVFVIIYIDDILIYLTFLFKHQKHVWMMLECLRQADLQCNIKKCKFHTIKVTYLGLIVSCDNIKMNPAKIEAVID